MGEGQGKTAGSLAALKEGKIDLAIADEWSLKDCACREVLFGETFTCLARQGHPRIRGELGAIGGDLSSATKAQ
jgi:DNA-binding transcriptional LysR family regulator